MKMLPSTVKVADVQCINVSEYRLKHSAGVRDYITLV